MHLYDAGSELIIPRLYFPIVALSGQYGHLLAAWYFRRDLKLDLRLIK